MARSAREFVADYIAAMNRHDVHGVVSFFADDSAYEDAAIGTVLRLKLVDRQSDGGVADFLSPSAIRPVFGCTAACAAVLSR